MYNPQDSIDRTYNYIQDLRAKGKSYGGYPVYNVTKSDLQSLMSLSSKYGIPFEWMVNLINFETGRTFSPSITNSIGATGLIQFMTKIGGKVMTYTKADGSRPVTTDSLRKMTFKEQLQYVDGYLSKSLSKYLNKNGKIPDSFTQGDLFMTIFYPVAVGKPNFTFPDSVNRANAGISKPYDYVERALRVSIFPLSFFPYTLEDVKKKFGEVAKFTKKNWLPITLTFIGIVGLGYYMYKTKKFQSVGKLIN